MKSDPVVTTDGLGTGPRQVDGWMDRLMEEGMEPRWIWWMVDGQVWQPQVDGGNQKQACTCAKIEKSMKLMKKLELLGERLADGQWHWGHTTKKSPKDDGG